MHLRRARPEDYDTIGTITVAAYQPQLTDSSASYTEHLANAAARELIGAARAAVVKMLCIPSSATIRSDSMMDRPSWS